MRNEVEMMNADQLKRNKSFSSPKGILDGKTARNKDDFQTCHFFRKKTQDALIIFITAPASAEQL